MPPGLPPMGSLAPFPQGTPIPGAPNDNGAQNIGFPGQVNGQPQAQAAGLPQNEGMPMMPGAFPQSGPQGASDQDSPFPTTGKGVVSDNGQGTPTAQDDPMTLSGQNPTSGEFPGPQGQGQWQGEGQVLSNFPPQEN